MPPTRDCDIDPAAQHLRIGQREGEIDAHARSTLENSLFGASSYLECIDDVVPPKGLAWGPDRGMGLGYRILVVSEEEIEIWRRRMDEQRKDRLGIGSRTPDDFPVGKMMVRSEAIAVCKAEAEAVCGFERCARAAGVDVSVGAMEFAPRAGEHR